VITRKFAIPYRGCPSRPPGPFKFAWKMVYGPSEIRYNRSQMTAKLSTRRAAPVAGISLPTLNRWIRDGKIKPPKRDEQSWIRLWGERDIERIRAVKAAPRLRAGRRNPETLVPIRNGQVDFEHQRVLETANDYAAAADALGAQAVLLFGSKIFSAK
jgi:hypothetical protein